MSNLTVKQVNTVTALKTWLLQLEKERVAIFTFRPGGALDSRYSGEQLQELVLSLMPLTHRIHTTTVTDGNGRTVTCTMTFRSGVRMLDAWRQGDLSVLNREELLAMPLAEQIVSSIRSHRGTPMDRLYLLYTYVSSLVDYRKEYISDQHFRQQASGAWALVNKEANCQGFADMMYLLGGMLGLRMGFQSGRSRAGGHMWNTVEMDGCVYALDASVSALVRTSSKHVRADYAAFLMGRREAAENGLTWSAEEETVKLSPSLAEEHDYYVTHGCAVANVRDAARLAWERCFQNAKVVHLRIRSKERVSLEDVRRAIARRAEEPEVRRELVGGSWRINLVGQCSDKASYVTVEWLDD